MMFKADEISCSTSENVRNAPEIETSYGSKQDSIGPQWTSTYFMIMQSIIANILLQRTPPITAWWSSSMIPSQGPFLVTWRRSRVQFPARPFYTSFLVFSCKLSAGDIESFCGQEKDESMGGFRSQQASMWALVVKFMPRPRVKKSQRNPFKSYNTDGLFTRRAQNTKR